MQMCQDHWDKLQEHIKEKGMIDFVASGGKEIASRMKKESKGEGTIPDPLMWAHNQIVQQAISSGGLYVMGMDENGEHYCPLCEARKNGPEDVNLDEEWMDNCTDHIQEYFKGKGLIGN